MQKYKKKKKPHIFVKSIPSEIQEGTHQLLRAFVARAPFTYARVKLSKTNRAKCIPNDLYVHTRVFHKARKQFDFFNTGCRSSVCYCKTSYTRALNLSAFFCGNTLRLTVSSVSPLKGRQPSGARRLLASRRIQSYV